MPWVYGISITIGITILEFLAAVGIGFVAAMLKVPIDAIKAIANVAVWGITIGLSIWVALDSKSIELQKYKTGLPANPVVLGVCCCLVFGIAFSWYLASRFKIKNGTATLKEIASK